MGLKIAELLQLWHVQIIETHLISIQFTVDFKLSSIFLRSGLFNPLAYFWNIEIGFVKPSSLFFTSGLSYFLVYYWGSQLGSNTLAYFESKKLFGDLVSLWSFKSRVSGSTAGFKPFSLYWKLSVGFKPFSLFLRVRQTL